MSAEYYSSVALVSGAAVYTLAVLAHAAEWAAARQPDDRRPSTGSEPARPSTGSPQVALAGVGAASEARVRGAGLSLLPPRPPNPTDSPVSPQRPRPQEPSRTALSPSATARVEGLGRAGLALTVIAFGLNVAGVVLRGVAGSRAPWGNMLEFLTTAMVAVVAVYLVLVVKTGARWLGLLVTTLAALANGLAVTVFYVAVAPLVPALHSVWFLIHILAATISAAAFNLGALTALLYLVKTRAERRGSSGGYLDRLPNTRALDRMSYRFHAFAFPLWTFTVAAGAIWAQYAWGRYWGWDPKETWALVTWVVYACYLHARSTAGWKGRRAAGLALLGVATFWFNFVGVNLLVSGLHSYAGV